MGFFDQDHASLADAPRGTEEFSPPPKGVYEVAVHSAKRLPTKAGGKRVSMRFDIVGPTHQGRVVFMHFNISNPPGKVYEKSDPAEIGGRQLTQVLESAGVSDWQLGPEHTNGEREVIGVAGKRLRLSLDVEKREGYEPQSKFLRALPSANAMPIPIVASAATAPAQRSNKDPWSR
jgi:hypothetical protein